MPIELCVQELLDPLSTYRSTTLAQQSLQVKERSDARTCYAKNVQTHGGRTSETQRAYHSCGETKSHRRGCRKAASRVGAPPAAPAALAVSSLGPACADADHDRPCSALCVREINVRQHDAKT